MIRKLLIRLSIAGVATIVLLGARGLLDRSDAQAASPDPPRRMTVTLPRPYFRPDTTATTWKWLSKEAGLEINQDQYLGLRARLYVRIDGRWIPVGIDGPSDIAQFAPAR